MTDTNPIYRRLAKALNGTRKTLTQVCLERDIDLDVVEDQYLAQVISQCSHCDVWVTQPVFDRDENPVCGLCYRLVGQ